MAAPKKSLVPKPRPRTKTEETTLRNRPVWIDNTGEVTGEKGSKYSEQTTTIPWGTEWITAPSIDENGKRLSDDEVEQRLIETGGKDFITGEKLPTFSNSEKASEYAQWRSDNMFDQEAIEQGFPEEFPMGPEPNRDPSLFKSGLDLGFTGLALVARQLGFEYYPTQDTKRNLKEAVGFDEGGSVAPSGRPGFRGDGPFDFKGFGSYLKETVSKEELTAGLDNAGKWLVPFYEAGGNMVNVLEEYSKPEEERDQEYIKEELNKAGTSAGAEAAMWLLGGVAAKYGSKGIKAIKKKASEYELDTNTVSTPKGMGSTPKFNEGGAVVDKQAAPKESPRPKSRDFSVKTSPRPMARGQRQEESKEYRDEYASGLDVEMRADMDPLLVDDPIARLGYDPDRISFIDDRGTMQASYYRPNSFGPKADTVEYGPTTGASKDVIAHEFRHRGLSLLDEMYEQDPEDFAEKYGKEAVTVLKGVGRELKTELRDNPDAEWNLPFRDPQTGDVLKASMGDTIDSFEDVEVLRKYVQTGELNTGSSRNDAIITKGLEGLDKAATDVLKERGEPDKAVKRDVNPGFFKRVIKSLGFSEGGMATQNLEKQTEEAFSSRPAKKVVKTTPDDSTFEFEIKSTGVKENFNEGGAVVDKQAAVGSQMEMAFGNEVDQIDPVSGNEVPPGSTPKEVRDDIPVMLSEGEYVIPADVTRYYGVKFFEDLRNQAKVDLAAMEQNGRIGGEPIPEDDELTDDEMALLQEVMMSEQETMGMFQGGMTTPTQIPSVSPPTQPMEMTLKSNVKLPTYSQSSGMAKGGDTKQLDPFGNPISQAPSGSTGSMPSLLADTDDGSSSGAYGLTTSEDDDPTTGRPKYTPSSGSSDSSSGMKTVFYIHKDGRRLPVLTLNGRPISATPPDFSEFLADTPENRAKLNFGTSTEDTETTSDETAGTTEGEAYDYGVDDTQTSPSGSSNTGVSVSDPVGAAKDALEGTIGVSKGVGSVLGAINPGLGVLAGGVGAISSLSAISTAQANKSMAEFLGMDEEAAEIEAAIDDFLSGQPQAVNNLDDRFATGDAKFNEALEQAFDIDSKDPIFTDQLNEQGIKNVEEYLAQNSSQPETDPGTYAPVSSPRPVSRPSTPSSTPNTTDNTSESAPTGVVGNNDTGQNSLAQSIANAMTPNDGMSYQGGVLTAD